MICMRARSESLDELVKERAVAGVRVARRGSARRERRAAIAEFGRVGEDLSRADLGQKRCGHEMAMAEGRRF